MGDNYVNLPIYSQLRNLSECTIISFNYTTFASEFTGNNAIYFHGCLKDYVEIETKISTTIREDVYSNINVVDFFRDNIKPNIDFTPNHHRYTIPSFLPPLKLKPVLGKNFITNWYNAAKAIEDSEKIIIIGYSFSASDEHFNGLLRACINNKEIIIIDPDSSGIMQHLATEMGIDPSRYTRSSIQNKPAYILGTHLTLVEAMSNEINLSQL